MNASPTRIPACHPNFGKHQSKSTPRMSHASPQRVARATTRDTESTFLVIISLRCAIRIQRVMSVCRNLNAIAQDCRVLAEPNVTSPWPMFGFVSVRVLVDGVRWGRTELYGLSRFLNTLRRADPCRGRRHGFEHDLVPVVSLRSTTGYWLRPLPGSLRTRKRMEARLARSGTDGSFPIRDGWATGPFGVSSLWVKSRRDAASAQADDNREIHRRRSSG